MTLRASAILVAVLAAGGLLASPIAVVMTAFLFDDPHAGGWPVLLLAGSLWTAPVFMLAALIVAGVAIVSPSTRLVRLAAIALAAPLILFVGGIGAVDVVCGGRFACGAAGR